MQKSVKYVARLYNTNLLNLFIGNSFEKNGVLCNILAEKIVEDSYEGGL